MDMQEFRSQINQIDEQLVRLFDARMKVALEIGKYKKANSLPVYDAAREQAVLERQMAAVEPEMAPYVRQFYLKLFELSKEYQQQTMQQVAPVEERECRNSLV